MAINLTLPNFSKGEIAPALYSQIDTQQYSAALKICKNFIVQRYGGVTFRPGTRFCGRIEVQQEHQPERPDPRSEAVNLP